MRDPRGGDAIAGCSTSGHATVRGGDAGAPLSLDVGPPPSPPCLAIGYRVIPPAQPSPVTISVPITNDLRRKPIAPENDTDEGWARRAREKSAECYILLYPLFPSSPRASLSPPFLVPPSSPSCRLVHVNSRLSAMFVSSMMYAAQFQGETQGHGVSSSQYWMVQGLTCFPPRGSVQRVLGFSAGTKHLTCASSTPAG